MHGHEVVSLGVVWLQKSGNRSGVMRYRRSTSTLAVGINTPRRSGIAVASIDEGDLDTPDDLWWICGRRNGLGKFHRIVGPYETGELLHVLGNVELEAFLRSTEGNRGPCFYWRIGCHRHPRRFPRSSSSCEVAGARQLFGRTATDLATLIAWYR